MPADSSQSFSDRLFVGWQYFLPQHLLSRLIHPLASCTWPPVKNPLIRLFAKVYGVDWQEALHETPEDYASFNEFFTRPLKPEVRPLDPDPMALLCPVDGVLSQAGTIHQGRVFQAKGHDYSAATLLGEETAPGEHQGSWADRFAGGVFATLYLSPRDYHRIHMPVDATLIGTRHIPGRLFSVNAATTRGVHGLFARNERVVCLFDSEAGPLAMVLVGAMIVASIATVWAGTITPGRRGPVYWNATPLRLERGREMGRFFLGSTVILLLGPDRVTWHNNLTPGTPLRLGQALGHWHP
ncbi:MAG: archaetidylserine decarboxylase [Pseudomonadota bacterium]